MNTNTLNHHARRLAAAVIAAPLFCVLPATSDAQQVRPAATPDAPTAENAPAIKPAQAAPAAPRNEDVVELSPFTVSSTAQTGYIASESMTGSRMPTKIIDLPYAIDVVTSEFLDDFAIVDESYIVEGGIITFDQDAGGESTIRGVRANGQLYNGFWQPAGTPVPGALKDRTEILKGPSAGIYGQTSPGGIKNSVSKKPKFKPSQKLRFSFGNYDQWTARAESTGPLTRKTAYLAILAADDRSFTQPWRANSNYTGAVSLLHKFAPDTQLTIELVGVNQRNKAPANRIPYLYDSTAVTLHTELDGQMDATRKLPARNLPDNAVAGRYYGLAWDLADTSGTGPNSWEDTDTYSLFAILEKRINKTFSFRFGTNYTANHKQYYNTVPLTMYDPDMTHGYDSRGIIKDPYSATVTYLDPDNPAGGTAGGFGGLIRSASSSSSFSAPSYQKRNQDNGGFQGDILAHYQIGKIDCRTLLTFDFNSRYDYTEKWASPQRVSSNSDGSPSTNNAVDAEAFPWDPNAIGTPGGPSMDYFLANYWLPIINPITRDSIYVDADAYPWYDVYHAPDFSKGKFVLRSMQKARRDVFGIMLRQQAILWNKVIAYGAIRFDNVTYKYDLWNYPGYSLKLHPQYQAYWEQAVKDGYSGARWHSANWTPSFGINYRPKQWLAVYANYSTSFNPSGQTVSGALNQTLILPNETAWGVDYGIKFTLLDDKLTGTISAFYISQENMSVTEEDPTSGANIKQAAGNVLSRGFEASVNYFVTKAWSVNAGYYHTDARWVYAGTDKDLIGRSRANVPPDIVTFKTKYSFQNGFFKGLSVFAAYQYSKQCPADEGGSKTFSPSAPDPVTGRIRTGYTPPGYNNGLRDLIVPSVWIADIGASYGFKIPHFWPNAKHSIQINVKNLFDKRYVTQSRGVADMRSIVGTYSVQF